MVAEPCGQIGAGILAIVFGCHDGIDAADNHLLSILKVGQGAVHRCRCGWAAVPCDEHTGGFLGGVGIDLKPDWRMQQNAGNGFAQEVGCVAQVVGKDGLITDARAPGHLMFDV